MVAFCLQRRKKLFCSTKYLVVLSTRTLQKYRRGETRACYTYSIARGGGLITYVAVAGVGNWNREIANARGGDLWGVPLPMKFE